MKTPVSLEIERRGGFGGHNTSVGRPHNAEGPDYIGPGHDEGDRPASGDSRDGEPSAPG